MDTSKHSEAEDTLRPGTAAPGSAGGTSGESPHSTVYVAPTRFPLSADEPLPANQATLAAEEPVTANPAANPVLDGPDAAEPSTPPPDRAPAANDPVAAIFERLSRHAAAGQPRPPDMPVLFQRLLRNR